MPNSGGSVRCLLGREAPQKDKIWALLDKSGEFSDKGKVARGVPGKGLQQKTENNGKFREHLREARGGPQRQKSGWFLKQTL